MKGLIPAQSRGAKEGCLTEVVRLSRINAGIAATEQVNYCKLSYRLIKSSEATTQR